MISKEIRINYSQLKEQIETSYFLTLDSFNRCLVVAITYFVLEEEIEMKSIFLENSHYNSLVHDLRYRLEQGHDILRELNTKSTVALYVDMMVYLEPFLKKNYIKSKTNVLSARINSDYNLVVELKQFGKIYEL